MTAPAGSTPVILAREGAFTLGAVRIDPPLREVVLDDTRLCLEPRVMQVLVALARAGGAIVTRDELIASCWGGRVVGEDAINRTLGRIRRLALESGGTFALETIRKVGYRLTVPPAAEPSRLAVAPIALPGFAAASCPDLIGGAYLALRQTHAAPAKVDGRRGGLRHAAFAAAFALAGSQLASAPYSLTASQTVAPAVVASAAAAVDVARQTVRVLVIEPHARGTAPEAAGGTLALRRFYLPETTDGSLRSRSGAPPLYGRSPDLKSHWLTPSRLTITFRLSELHRI